MKLINILEIIIRSILLIPAAYHIIKKEYKKMWPLALIFVLTFLPALLERFLGMHLDAVSIILYNIILIMTLYLGGALGFYDLYKWWDRSIHFLSGVAFVGFGIAVIRITPGTATWGVMFFGFTFSLTLHVFWEVLEYLNDCITHGDAQRWQKIHKTTNHVSEKAIQPAGLVDTMNDFICCIIGAVLAVLTWWFIM